MTSIYFINPRADFPTYFNAENYTSHGIAPATQMADLTIPTLAAMVPAGYEVKLCDQNISPVDYGCEADLIGITGKITQVGHMIEIANQFRAAGKTIVMGGPLASLSPDLLRPHCDILIQGEIEEIAPQLFGDLASGHYKDTYVGNKPDLNTSPVPRWELYPNDRAVMGTLQTSRGCPFECEFCDVIQYAGRKQRHKQPARVLAELDLLYRVGYRAVFLADDNFTVYRARARELLLAIKEWNDRREHGRVLFLTQLSVDIAQDDEMLKLCAEAGLTTVFIGLETPNEDSLRETKKRQNLKRNLVDDVHAFYEHGIHVIGGMIVGFDADGPDIFQRQFDFAMAAAIPIFSLGALVAPAATPLHARLKAAGRLRPDRSAEVAAVPWATNIVHPRMTLEQLMTGLRWLGNNLYSPQSFGDRLEDFIGRLGRQRTRGSAMQLAMSGRAIDQDVMKVLTRVRELGPAENRLWARMTRCLIKKPEAALPVFTALVQYMQIRYMYQLGHFWEPQLVGAVPPAPSTGLVTLRGTHDRAQA